VSRVVALGEAARVAGFALAGVTVLESDAGGPLAAWDRLPDDTGLVVLTPMAADALAGHLRHDDRLLWAVLPP
jgi:vacuolar-type H+-ATPase subunit F/Vma7